LQSAMDFSPEELTVAMKLENYFNHMEMDFLEKVFQARLIATHELELGHPASERERVRVMTFMDTLDTIWHKLTGP